MQNLKILFSSEKRYFGGAEISAQILLKNLAKEHEVHVLYAGKEKRDYAMLGLKIHEIRVPHSIRIMRSSVGQYYLNKYWQKILANFLRQNSFDLILTQQTLTPSTVKMAKKENIPVVYFIHDYRAFCPTGYLNCPKDIRDCFRCVSTVRKIIYPLTRKMLSLYQQAMFDSNVLIANSGFTASVVERFTGIKCDIIPPFIEFPAVEKKVGDYIGFVRPDKLKGVETFIKFASKSKRKYLVIGPIDKEHKDQIQSMPNVKHISWSNNMAELYSQMKILVMPSIWKEPFGMVLVEAMSNGIPCIASDIGACSEVIGKGGIIIEDKLNPDAWIEQIERLFQDKKLYDKLSRNALKQAKKFSPENTLKEFKNVLKKRINVIL